MGGVILGYNKILIANTGDDSLTLVYPNNIPMNKTFKITDLITNNNLSFINNGKLGPYDMNVGKGGYIYITNSYDNSLMKIDLEEEKVLDLIKTGKNPTCLKVFKGRIYIINSDSNSLSIIDEETFSLLECISLGENPTDIQIDEKREKIFIANRDCHKINILDLNNDKISSMVLNTLPIKIIMEDNRLFVLSFINNGVKNYSNLSEIKIQDYKIIMSINLKGVFTHFIKIKGKEIFYLTNIEDECIYRISNNEKTKWKKIFIGGMPNNIVWDGKSKIYVTNTSTKDLIIIDEKGQSIINNIRVGNEPYGILLL